MMRVENCPFYGCSMEGVEPIDEGVAGEYPVRPFKLLGKGGNQCALILATPTACGEEMNGRLVNWRTCRLLRSMRIDFAGGRKP